MKKYLVLALLCALTLSVGDQELHAQQHDESLYDAIEFRNIGPFRGGRSAAVTGVASNPDLYYFGGTGGGVWKTEDAGSTWSNISDGYFGGSIGAVAVAPSDENVIYVGGGEKTVRGNVSYGYGMWKSVDGGKTWEQIGLENSRHISRIRIHPQNPDVVYAAVMGNLFSSSSERGVYKSVDGGQNWRKVLFANADAGAVDLVMDPGNPRVLYASTWRIRRTPYSLSSGGDGSGLWKSTDSGENWEEITRNEGLPTDTVGIIGVTVSPQNSERVWAIIESKTGGVFRSDDGGSTWSKLNESRSLRQRAWYYTRIFADSQDEDIVYVLNVRYHRSKDGGKTFEAFNAPHGDHHDLWIDPDNNQRMIIGDDGGAQVSKNGGATWTTYHNQPTSQFYRVTTDNHFPYRIYAAQQDNSTIRISSRTSGYAITEDDWEATAGCECGHIAIDPLNQEIVYGGCYDGVIERQNHDIDQSRAVSVWPDNPMGHGAEGMRYRFQWNFPIFFSPHDPKKLYTASNHLHVSTNGGSSWDIISPDLTRNDPTKLVSSGGPITQDNTSVEYYCTIFAAAESPRVKDLLWVGSDDGLVHISRDGGENWSNITPEGLPEWTMINSIEPDPHSDGGCYLAATSYKNGDFKPYLYKTKDYGKTWTKIVRGIDAGHFTRVVRSDLNQPGLLYAGTESGLYVSFDDGSQWQAFQLNLPIVPITDLAVKDNNLVVATQGRSLWVVDDLSPLYQLEEKKNESFFVFKPKDTYRMRGGQAKDLKTAGTNHPAGAMIYFHLPALNEDDESVATSIHILDSDGTEIDSYSTENKKENKLEVESGSNLFTWDLRHPDAEKFEGMIFWAGSLTGPMAMPGEYTVRIDHGDESVTEKFTILMDPRSEASEEELLAQFNFIQDVNAKVSEAHQTIKEIRKIKSQMNQLKPILKGDEQSEDLLKEAEDIEKKISEIEKTLYQTQNQSRQDPLNFPIRLTNKLAYLNTINRGGDYAPTQQQIGVKEDIGGQIDQQLDIFRSVVEEDLPRFNENYRSKSLDVIKIDQKKDVN
ncbi:MAG: glycosyl hydrolase [Saprospiraceae bacterium]|nr:glycosyl hydrolase [Saprospiraceae bacterium]